MGEHGRIGPVEWAVSARPRPGESISGDLALVVEIGSQAALFAVIDGLGHGVPAAAAARCAEQVLRREASLAPEVLIARCHAEMAETRGAAITLVRVDFQAGMLRWVGVGNVSADLLARAPSGIGTRTSARLLGGIVGYGLPEIPAPEGVAIRAGHLIVMASDGVGENLTEEVDFAAPADVLAAQILRDHGRDCDDALVLVARHRGRWAGAPRPGENDGAAS